MKKQQFRRFILDSVPVAMVTMDADLKITSFNIRAEELTGYAAHEAIGQPCHMILRSSRCENDCPLQTVASSMESATGLEGEIVDRFGDHVPVRIGTAAIESDDGSFVGYLEVIEDIARQKEMEREKHNFISMVAHDMKSPLIAIGGLINRLKKEQTCKGNEKLQEYLRVIGDAEARLESLAQEFLEYSRLESSQLNLQQSETSIEELLQKVTEIHRPRAEEQKIDLSCECKPLPAIKADADRLHRVFTNILDNAIKYSPEKAEVTISVKETDQEIVIRFKDQGWGIADEELPYIFDAFYRADAKEKSTGHGLGLAAVKAIVRQHGGRVSVTSTPGKGSVFTVRLPKEEKPL
ncbi:MAG: PAS domain S-box protein [Desulfobulbaceae bacterium]|nr:PAS domain S-box protein [Desulfobulbaceae bacterium]